jgi:DME family drug/metabolite transporter
MAQSAATYEEGSSGEANWLGYAGVLTAAVCWGTSGGLVKLILAAGEISALALAFWRDLTTFVLLLLMLRLLRPDWLRVEWRDLIWLVGLGGSLGTFHVFWNLAVMLNGAAVATVQQAAVPAIVAVAAWLLWREPLTGRKILAILLTFGGTVLVSGVDALSRADVSLGGFLAGLCTPVAYAGYSLFGKKVRGGYSPLTALTYGFGIAALALLPFQFFTPQPWPVPLAALPWFAGLIIIATIVPFYAYVFALGRLDASVVSILAMVEIPIVAVYAYFLLGERMSIEQVFGAVLVVVGVLMLSWRRRRQRVPRGD